MKNAIVKSPATTWAGVGQFLAFLGAAIAAQFDNDPATQAQWMTVVSSLVIMIGLFAARDSSVSSEKAGAK